MAGIKPSSFHFRASEKGRGSFKSRTTISSNKAVDEDSINDVVVYQDMAEATNPSAETKGRSFYNIALRIEDPHLNGAN